MRGSVLGMLVLGFMLAGVLRSQGIDTVLFRESTGTKRFTIIDQVTDPQERRALLKLYGAHQPQKRRKLAEEFVARHPQSWLLAQAFLRLTNTHETLCAHPLTGPWE